MISLWNPPRQACCAPLPRIWRLNRQRVAAHRAASQSIGYLECSCEAPTPMSRSNTPPVPLAHVARLVVPDGEKLMLTPLDFGLQTMGPYLSAEARTTIVNQFGAYLGKPNHPIPVS